MRRGGAQSWRAGSGRSITPGRGEVGCRVLAASRGEQVKMQTPPPLRQMLRLLHLTAPLFAKKKYSSTQITAIKKFPW